MAISTGKVRRELGDTGALSMTRFSHFSSCRRNYAGIRDAFTYADTAGFSLVLLVLFVQIWGEEFYVLLRACNAIVKIVRKMLN